MGFGYWVFNLVSVDAKERSFISLLSNKHFAKPVQKVCMYYSILGSAIKNMGLFSKIPIDFKIETRDF